MKSLLTRLGLSAPPFRAAAVLVVSAGGFLDLEKMLKQSGVTVDHATSVKDAEDKSTLFRYEAAIVDIRNESGWSFVKVLRSNVPVIGVVDHESAAIRGLMRGLDAALNIGAVGAAELKWALKKAADSRHPASGLSEGVRRQTERTLDHVSSILREYALH